MHTGQCTHNTMHHSYTCGSVNYTRKFITITNIIGLIEMGGEKINRKKKRFGGEGEGIEGKCTVKH